MSRNPSSIIRDILDCIDRIQVYTLDISFDEFSENFMAVEACLYNFQIMGEAVSQLPDEFKQKETHIPWSLIKGMRNRLIHEYFGTDIFVVWNTIKNDLPSLKADLAKIASELSSKGQ